MFSSVRCFKFIPHLLKPFNRTFLRNPTHTSVSGEFFRKQLPTDYSTSVPQFSTVGKVDTVSEDKFVDSYYDSVDYDGLSKGDETLLKKLKVIVLEVEVMRQNGARVPSVMKNENWAELLSMPTKGQRIKLLNFFAVKESRKKKDKIKQEMKRLEKGDREQRTLEIKNNQHIHYGFGGSTIFLRVYDTKLDDFLNQKVIQAMMFGQDLILDCGYDEHMSLAEASNCAKQLGYVFSENRKHDDPFNIHFLNAHRESKVMRKLEKIIPTLYDPSFPMNLSDKHYLDLFPKEKLVYLTPHCRNDLEEFNYDDIYIIGGMVDKVKPEPLSLAKAKFEGLRVARFPLDRYLSWSIGSKSLTIDQVLKILLDLKLRPKDWGEALRHVPRRKIREGVEPQNWKKAHQSGSGYKSKFKFDSFFKDDN